MTHLKNEWQDNLSVCRRFSFWTPAAKCLSVFIFSGILEEENAPVLISSPNSGVFRIPRDKSMDWDPRETDTLGEWPSVLILTPTGMLWHLGDNNAETSDEGRRETDNRGSVSEVTTLRRLWRLSPSTLTSSIQIPQHLNMSDLRYLLVFQCLLCFTPSSFFEVSLLGELFEETAGTRSVSWVGLIFVISTTKCSALLQYYVVALWWEYKFCWLNFEKRCTLATI